MLTGFYQENKQRLRKNTPEKSQNLSEKDKNKKQKYVLEPFRKLPEDEKQKLIEYSKRYSKIQKINTGQVFY